MLQQFTQKHLLLLSIITIDVHDKHHCNYCNGFQFDRKASNIDRNLK